MMITSIIRYELKEWSRRVSFWLISAAFLFVISQDFLMTLRYTKDAHIFPFIAQDIAMCLLGICPFLMINQLDRLRSDLKTIQYPLRQSLISCLVSFVAVSSLLCFALSLTSIVIPISLTVLDTPDWGVIISSYLGLLLISILSSSITLLVASSLRYTWTVYVVSFFVLFSAWFLPVISSNYLWVQSFTTRLHQLFLPFFYGGIDLQVVLLSIGVSGLCILLGSVAMKKIGMIKDEVA